MTSIARLSGWSERCAVTVLVSQLPYLYRLVCWGLFLGDDFLEGFGDGSLINVALSNAGECERFDQIAGRMTRNSDSR